MSETGNGSETGLDIDTDFGCEKAEKQSVPAIVE